ncbi:MAG: hypothetical protein IAC51_01695 [bacterium]|uniref:Uncharacterized protein n=1 Tax=Candidatus Aphodosoma intestinipullorum TaxID=2840674 RepID=A0A940DKU1_9BACT|nr:hypothetical protein [Candidatus Aphodosoma intestinipullorum]
MAKTKRAGKPDKAKEKIALGILGQFSGGDEEVCYEEDEPGRIYAVYGLGTDDERRVPLFDLE